MSAVSSMQPTRARYPDLAGKRVLVTGGAAGLGLGIAEAFAEQGGRIALMDIDRGTLEETRDRLRRQGAEVLALEGSVTDADAVERTFAAVDSSFGGLDILVNNAGIAANKPTLD